MTLTTSYVWALPIVVITAYFTYQLFFHPLAGFPGPFFASVSNFWRFYHEIKGDLPLAIHECHKRYGAFIRVAPNEISTDHADVVDVVYRKGGRHYRKSEFYDGFTAVRPNMFGTRDEELHSIRRRQMANAFSQASLMKMEYIFNRHTVAMLDKLDQRQRQGRAFDLVPILRFYSRDVNGDLSLGVQFGTQNSDNPASVPPLNEHVALAKLTGYVPWTKKLFAQYGRYIPWPYLQKLLKTRAEMRDDAFRFTDIEFKRAGRTDAILDVDIPEDDEPGRINLLSLLVRARDPDTGEPIERAEVTSNTFSFLVAGSHSTAATLEMLFWYLCRYPDVQTKCQDEIAKAFKPPEGNEDILSYIGLEGPLPYCSAVLQESFRLSPTFQHPAPRTVPPSNDPKWPTVIDGRVIPTGAISASVYSLHRSKAIWGPDATSFRPQRWFEEESRQNDRLLMHFGSGHRACVGRNQAMMMIWKVFVESLRRYSFSFPQPDLQRPENPKLHVCGFAELAEPLMVETTSL